MARWFGHPPPDLPHGVGEARSLPPLIQRLDQPGHMRLRIQHIDRAHVVFPKMLPLGAAEEHKPSLAWSDLQRPPEIVIHPPQVDKICPISPQTVTAPARRGEKL